MASLPCVSVVIAVRPDVPTISRTLASLARQTYAHREVFVVVRGAPTDALRAQLTHHPPSLITLSEERLLGVPNRRGAQVNEGVLAARGEFIFFPDSDMTFDPHLLAEIVERLREADALYIPEVVRGRGFFGRVRAFERQFYTATSIDAVRAVRRALFLRVGGFDERLPYGPDDWDLTREIQRVTARMSTTGAVLYHHEEHLGWRTYLRKKRQHLDAFLPYQKKWGMKDQEVQRQLSPLYRLGLVFLEQGKWRKFLRHPILAAAVFALRVGIGIPYAFHRLRMLWRNH